MRVGRGWGRGRSGQGEQHEEERRSVGVKALGEVEMWLDAGGGQGKRAGVGGRWTS